MAVIPVPLWFRPDFIATRQTNLTGPVIRSTFVARRNVLTVPPGNGNNRTAFRFGKFHKSQTWRASERVSLPSRRPALHLGRLRLARKEEGKKTRRWDEMCWQTAGTLALEALPPPRSSPSLYPRSSSLLMPRFPPVDLLQVCCSQAIIIKYPG